MINMKLLRTLNTLNVIILLACLAVPLLAFGETSVIDGAQVAAEVAKPMLVKLATNYPWLTGVLVVLGILRFVFKPLIALLEMIVAATPGDADDEFFKKCQASVAYRWIWFVVDWLGSIKPPGVSSTNPALTNQK